MCFDKCLRLADTATASEAPKLKDNEAIVNEAWLKQIIEHASREAMENGALDDDAVSQMAQVSLGLICRLDWLLIHRCLELITSS